MFRNAFAASVKGDSVISSKLSVVSVKANVALLNDVNASVVEASSTPSLGVFDSQLAYYPIK